MPRFRPDIAALSPYVPGRAIEEVAAEVGIAPGDIVKLASNECPDGPFPGAVAAVTRLLGGSNRYPDNDARELTGSLSAHLGVSADHLWFGNGSVGLISAIATAVGGPGTSSVYAWPSFVMYRLASRWALSEPIEVPLTTDLRHDLDAMLEAIRTDTTVVYLCNPNNPTATIVDSGRVAAFIAAVPDSVLLVVDEAYHEYVTDDTYASAVPQALARENVVVLRTFSKVYALAGHRIGYAVAAAPTIAGLRKAQPPFGVTDFAQAAAVASLADSTELKRRIEANAAGRHHLLGALVERSLAPTPSQTNFVYFETPHRADVATGMLESRGVIVRPMSGRWLRVTIGHEGENERLVSALDAVLSTPARDLG